VFSDLLKKDILQLPLVLQPTTRDSKEMNHLLIGFSRVYPGLRCGFLTKRINLGCLSAVGPKCDMLSTQNLCLSDQTVAKSKVRKATVLKPKSGCPKFAIAIEDSGPFALETGTYVSLPKPC
jgi:hypothetical protein